VVLKNNWLYNDVSGIFVSGIGYIQCGNCFSCILCNVHDSDYYCQCDNVQGILLNLSFHPLGFVAKAILSSYFPSQSLGGPNSHLVLSFVQDWSGQNVSSIASEICGFITVLSGTIILHATREQEPATAPGTTMPSLFLYFILFFGVGGVVFCWLIQDCTININGLPFCNPLI